VKITPLDIKKQEFEKKFRGYSPEEVHAYLDSVAAEFEEILKKNLELEEKLLSTEGKLNGYTKMESILQDTLVTTQKSSEDMKTAAEMKARGIIDEARVAAEKIISESRERVMQIRREIEDLKNQRESFIINLKSLLDTQRSMLELIQKSAEGKSDFNPVRMRSDLTDAELENVVNEFEKELSQNQNSGDSENN